MRFEIEHVRLYLQETYLPLQLDPDAVYLNEIADVIDLEVVRSRTLVEEAMHWLELGEEPTYDQGLFGIFAGPFTFDPAYRLDTPRLVEFERDIGRMLSLQG